MKEHRSDMPSTAGGGANKRLGFGLFVIAIAMVGLSFAAVPLYSMFCQVTGYGGTTQRTDAPSGKVLDRMITVRFDSNVSSDLGWAFHPAQREVRLKIGEDRLVFYKARNLTDKRLTGTATFNVTPEIVGSYFNKVECFCFTEQTLQAGQEIDMPVSFFIDPEIVNDQDAKLVREITLSYTFFKTEETEQSTEPPSNEGTSTQLFENTKRPG